MSQMTTISTLKTSDVDFGAKDSASGRHHATMAYVCLSLSMGMLVHQTTGIERGSWQYVVYVIFAVALPLLSLSAIIRCLFGRCWILLLWLTWTGAWFFLAGDDRAVAQLALLVLVTSWVATDQAQLGVRELVRIYIALILVGMVILSVTTLNPYSMIPGRAIPEYGIWRVSFFPNIAYSGTLSLALLLVSTRDAKSARTYWLPILIAVYFLVFSFVRGALLSALLYFALRWWFGRSPIPQPRRMFWTTLCVAFGFVGLTAVSANLLYLAQDYPGVSMLLLRGMTDLTVDQIAYQLYRPWLWAEQLSLFQSSPWLMGWGSADFYGMVAQKQADPDALIISAGSESLPMRLLVAYGLSGLLFLIYLVQRLRKLAIADDRWACACFPALFSLMMSWGSVFHPSDAMFVIFMLIMTKGSAGFTSQEASGVCEAESNPGIPPAVAQV